MAEFQCYLMANVTNKKTKQNDKSGIAWCANEDNELKTWIVVFLLTSYV